MFYGRNGVRADFPINSITESEAGYYALADQVAQGLGGAAARIACAKGTSISSSFTASYALSF
jgi:hypothetical protein